MRQRVKGAFRGGEEGQRWEKGVREGRGVQRVEGGSEGGRGRSGGGRRSEVGEVGVRGGRGGVRGGRRRRESWEGAAKGGRGGLQQGGTQHRRHPVAPALWPCPLSHSLPVPPTAVSAGRLGERRGPHPCRSATLDEQQL